MLTTHDYISKEKKRQRVNGINRLKLVISYGIDTEYESWNQNFTGKSDLTKENR
jgi:hypothetical protein